MYTLIKSMFRSTHKDKYPPDGLRDAFGILVGIGSILFIIGAFYVACEERRIEQKKQVKLEQKKAKQNLEHEEYLKNQINYK